MTMSTVHQLTKDPPPLNLDSVDRQQRIDISSSTHIVHYNTIVFIHIFLQFHIHYGRLFSMLVSAGKKYGFNN